MFYLWFASKSPYAKTLKVDCDWMIHLMPAFAGIIVWYVLWLYAFSSITYVCLLICAVSLWVWRCETTRHWVLFPDINHHRLE
jgi:Flp pilus assembly protein TadB